MFLSSTFNLASWLMMQLSICFFVYPLPVFLLSSLSLAKTQGPVRAGRAAPHCVSVSQGQDQRSLSDQTWWGENCYVIAIQITAVKTQSTTLLKNLLILTHRKCITFIPSNIMCIIYAYEVLLFWSKWLNCRYTDIILFDFPNTACVQTIAA